MLVLVWMSDLFPICWQVKTKDEQKYKRVHEEVLKRVDKYENDNQPQVSISIVYINLCWSFCTLTKIKAIKCYKLHSEPIHSLTNRSVQFISTNQNEMCMLPITLTNNHIRTLYLQIVTIAHILIWPNFHAPFFFLFFYFLFFGSYQMLILILA